MTLTDPLARGFRYLTDVSAPGLLHAAVLRSPHPHARILSIDTSDACALAGVVVVATARDIPGKARFGIRVADQPILCDDRVRSIGDSVAAVAAQTPAIARRALALLRVTYEVLPTVGDAGAALAPGAPAIHDGGNLLHTTRHARGALSEAFAASAHVIEDVYETPRQVHAFMEPEGAVAIPGPDGMTVFAPGHWAEIERQEIAAMLAVDASRVRVVASPVGGSYGGKDALHAQPIAALLAHLSGRPVRLLWPREDSFAIGVKRHPFLIRMRSGCTSDGRLTGHEVDLLADTGAYAQHGPEVLETAHENAQGPYGWMAVRIEGRLAYTNNGIAGAMRGFGAVQVQTALEQQIDRLAAACGLDPVEFRSRNLRAEDAPCQLGQTLVAPSWHSRACERLSRPPPPRREGRFLIGTGVALIEKGEGFARGGPNHASTTLMLMPDGRIEVRCGLSDLGQGLAEAAAEAGRRLIGCSEEDIRVVLADTAVTPDSGPIAASRGAGIVWRTIERAAPAFTRALLARAAERCGLPPDDLAIGPGGVRRRGDNAAHVPFSALAGEPLSIEGETAPIETTTGDGAAHAVFASCAAEATVSVDTATGRVSVRRVRFWPVSGPVLSASGLRAQMEGGAAMAAGFVTLEDLPATDGRFRARNLDGYFVPTIADAFPVDVEAIEDIPPDIVGPRGVGETGVNAAAPAIATAILAATGFVCRTLPVDPQAMLLHLRSRR